MKRAMIVAAHPDDAELAMGGTIAKMIEYGWDVVIVDLTDGRNCDKKKQKMQITFWA